MSVLQDFFSPRHLAKDQRRAYRLWLIGGSICLVVSIALVVYVIEVGIRTPTPRSYLRKNVIARIAPLFVDQINAARGSARTSPAQTASKASSKTTVRQGAATTTKAIQQNVHQ